MRKHFLILMLLTLLPLAGWAQLATFGEMSLGKYTYGGGSAPVPLVRDSEGTILTEGTHYIVNNGTTTGVFTDADCKAESEVAAFSNLKADGTRYYRQVTGKATTAYEGQTVSAYFTVEKAELTLTLKAGKYNRTYGANQVAVNDDATVDFNIGATQFGQAWADIKKGSKPTYSTADNNAGVDKEITFNGGWTADNYSIKYVGTLTISAKDIGGSATITKFQGDVVYTGKNIIGVYTVKDGSKVLTAGTPAVLYADKDEYNAAKGTTLDDAAFAALSDAEKTKTAATGDYYVAPVKDVADSPCTPLITFHNNYSGSIVPGTSFDVTPAPITVSLKNIVEVAYNDADQADQSALAANKFNYSGIVGDDIADAADIKYGVDGFKQPTSVEVDGEAKTVGDYALVLSGATVGTYTNYYIKDYLPGTLRINQREVALKAKNVTKNLGAADPAFSLAAGLNFVAGHVVSGVTFTREGGEDVGSYDITPDYSAISVKSGDDDVTSNYAFSIDPTKGQLEITQGAIIVTIMDAEKFYGEADPTFTYEVTGLQGTDELAAFDITRDAGEDVKGYALNATVVNPNPERYTSVTVVPGIFTIKKAELTFTMPAQNLAKGKKATDLKKNSITVSGIKNSDVAADLYELSFNGVSVDGSQKTNADEVVNDGIKATLKAAAQAHYKVVGTNAVDGGTAATGKIIVGTGGGAGINFTSVDTDYDIITGRADETANVTLIINPRNNREVPAGTKHKWAAKTWNTMVLPFKVSVATLSQALGYAIVNRVDAANTTGTNVQFKLEMDEIPANEPFCVKTTGDIANDYVINFGSVKIVAPADEYPSVDAGNGYKFVGAYKEMTIDKTKSTLKFLRGDAVKWANIGGTSANTWKVVPFDAYIDLSTAPSPELVTFTFQEIDGTFTSIKAVEAGSKDDNVIYNIAGQKVNASYKGIVIKNGKKYFQK